MNSNPTDIIAFLRNKSGKPAPIAAIPTERKMTAVETTTAPASKATGLQEAIDAARKLDGAIVEICGMWAWVTDTQHHDALISIGYKYSKGKGKYYFAGCAARSRGGASMGYIRTHYGSQIVAGKDD